MMRFATQWVNKVGGLLSATLIRNWMATLDYKVAYFDPTIDPITTACRTPGIYCFWHEYLLFPIYLRGNNNLTMLLSRHRDADVLSRAAYHLGFDTVRGSTNRGGVQAIRELLRKSRQMHLTITPDGPRGPRRRFAAGPIYLSSKLGIPLVLMGFGYDRPWRINSWDRFAIPKLWSRARAVVSPHVQIPPDLRRDGIEHYRLRIERLLLRLNDEAEAWAQSGTRKIGQSKLRRQSAPLRSHRIDAPHTGIAGRIDYRDAVRRAS